MNQPNNNCLPCPYCGEAPAVIDELSNVHPHVTIECMNAECSENPLSAGDNMEEVLERWNTRAPIDMIIRCPSCGFHHVDAPTPDQCKNCGGLQHLHNIEFEPEFIGACDNFEPWLNEPHKKHRCGRCNLVFKPANVPTNGVIELFTPDWQLATTEEAANA